jgi:EAL domain-containing protein (putative c-di-GMP-specific phosphodiesterase class I)
MRQDNPDQPIALEVHEACAVDAPTIKMLRLVLDDLGMQLAYDDFGAGQARLHELVEARPDFLKFDRKLIAGLDSATPERLQMLQSLVEMCRQLEIMTLAEGIETAGEARACRLMGFQLMQGYFFGRPLSRPELILPDSVVRAAKGDTTISIAKSEALTERMKR